VGLVLFLVVDSRLGLSIRLIGVVCYGLVIDGWYGGMIGLVGQSGSALLLICAFDLGTQKT